MGIEALFDGSAEAIEPTPEPIVEAVTEPEIVEPVAPEPQPEPETAAEPEVKEDPRSIPLPTFLDMRDRAKAAERRAEELEAKVSAPAPVDMPDPIDDPQGFVAWQQGQFQQALVAERFNWSDTAARQVHGDETVKAAAEWAFEKAKADPAFGQTYMQQQHPLDWIVREHKRNGLITEIGDNVDDWFTREAAKRGYQAASAPLAATPQPVVTPQPAVKPAVPPRSIASDAQAPAVAGEPAADFMAIFQR